MFDYEILLIILLVIQGIVAVVDTLVNHELLERLPTRVEARSETRLHALREMIYAMIFAATAWYEWHGAWGLVVGALFALAILVDAIDELVENHTRVLPPNERILHFIMIMNLGLIAATLLTVLFAWAAEPTAVRSINRGPWSTLLTLLSVASFCWAVRDAVAWWRLRRPRMAG